MEKLNLQLSEQQIFLLMDVLSGESSRLFLKLECLNKCDSSNVRVLDFCEEIHNRIAIIDSVLSVL